MTYPRTQQLDPAVQPDFDRANGQAGLLCPTGRGWSLSTLAIAANRAYYVRFVPSRTMVVASIVYLVTTAAGSNDNVDVGLYDAALGKLATAGATASKLNSRGRTAVALSASVTLQAGTVYYAAVSCGAIGTTAASLAAAAWADSLGAKFAGATAGLIDGDFMDTAHPLPTTLTLGGGIASQIALFLVETT